MNRYKYIGNNFIFFRPGEIALGRTVENAFKVQVDRLKHPWSHGWHLTVKEDWELCSYSLEQVIYEDYKK